MPAQPTQITAAAICDPTVSYDMHGRMRYHPEYHPNQGKQWMRSDERYLIDNYVELGPEVVALGLGRTIGTIMSYVWRLRKSGKMKPAEKASIRIYHRRELSGRKCK